jgi:hypothetical protein
MTRVESIKKKIAQVIKNNCKPDITTENFWQYVVVGMWGLGLPTRKTGWDDLGYLIQYKHGHASASEQQRIAKAHLSEFFPPVLADIIAAYAANESNEYLSDKLCRLRKTTKGLKECKYHTAGIYTKDAISEVCGLTPLNPGSHTCERDFEELIVRTIWGFRIPTTFDYNFLASVYPGDIPIADKVKSVRGIEGIMRKVSAYQNPVERKRTFEDMMYDP